MNQNTINVLNSLESAFNAAHPGSFQDFMATINGSPAMQAQLDAYLGSRGGTITTSTGIVDAGQYTPYNAASNTQNTQKGSIVINPTVTEGGQPWSVGYGYAETLAHELGHANDPELGNGQIAGDAFTVAGIYTRSEAVAEINSYNLMTQAAAALIGGPNVSAAGGQIYGSSATFVTDFRFAERAYTECSSNAPVSTGSGTSGVSAANMCVDAVATEMGKSGSLGGYNYFNKYYDQITGTTGGMPAHELTLDTSGTTAVTTNTGTPNELDFTNSQTHDTTKVLESQNADGSYSISATNYLNGVQGAVSTVSDTPSGQESISLSGSGFNVSGGFTTAVAISSNSQAQVTGADLAISTGSNVTLTVNNGAPELTGAPSRNIDEVTSSGTGGKYVFEGKSGVDSLTSGATITDQTLNQYDTFSGNNTISVGAGVDGLSLGDGATSTLSGTTSGFEVNTDRSTITDSSSGLDVYGNDNTAVGQSGSSWSFDGLSDVFQGSGSHLVPLFDTSLSILGNDTVNLGNSNVLLSTTGSDTFDFLAPNLTGITLYGDSGSIIGTTTGDDFTLGGIDDTSTLPDSTTTFLGETSGDTIGAGSSSSDITSPDTTYDPPAFDTGDPIVLNLAGAKVQTQNLATSSAYFDMQNIGVKDHTGWGTAGEGYLVYDPSNKNTVVNDASLVPSFSSLAGLDSNQDGVLNSLDSAWSHLKVWVDPTGAGTFSSSQLFTMAQEGIASINLNGTAEKVNSNNNTILEDSTFSWTKGGTGDIAGVEFDYHANTVQVATGGGGGGGGCVEIASVLPDGRRASDIAIGSVMELAHERTLEPGTGTVTYSVRKRYPGYRITTQSGISLVCSDTAPIPTPNGLVRAPDLLGLKVPTRRDDQSGSHTAWETVEVVEAVGEIEVQHITVGDRCFWAGETRGAYILHHNVKEAYGRTSRELP